MVDLKSVGWRLWRACPVLFVAVGMLNVGSNVYAGSAEIRAAFKQCDKCACGRSEGRIQQVQSKLTPENPIPGGEVSWEQEAIAIEIGGASPTTSTGSVPGMPTGVGSTGPVGGDWDGGSVFQRMTLTQNGPSVAGSYAVRGGHIFGRLQGGVFEGVWSQDGSQSRCSQPASDGRYNWGRVVLRLTGDSFSGGWSYCEAPV